MSRLIGLALLAAFVPGEEVPRTDLYGDPLPDGVRVRCGAARLQVDEWPSAEFSRDGKTLRATAGGRVTFWNVATGRREKTLSGPDEDGVRATLLSPDGKVLGGVGDKGAYLWDAETHRLLHHFKAGSCASLGFSSDGKTLVTGGGDFDGSITNWDVASGKERWKLRGDARGASRLLLAADARTLFALRTLTGRVESWDLETGKELAQIAEPYENRPEVVLLLRDKTLLLAGGRTVEGAYVALASIRDPATGKELRRIDGLDDLLTGAVLSPDGKTVFVSERDGPIRAFDLATGAELVRWPASGRVLAVSPDGKVVAGRRGTATIGLWDAATGKPLHDRPAHDTRVTGLAFTPDGKSIASAVDAEVRVWDAATGKQRFRMGPPARIGTWWDGVGVLSADRMFSGGGRRGVRTWEASTGQEAEVLALREIRRLFAVRVEPSGKALIAVGSLRGATVPDDRLISCVVDVATGKALSTLEWVYDAQEWGLCKPALSPDGGRLAYTQGGATFLLICDAATGKNQVEIKVADPIFERLAFSPDRKRLAARCVTRKPDDKREHVRMYDATTGKELLQVPLPDQGTQLTFSPTGRTLALAQQEFLHLIDPDTGKDVWRSPKLDARISQLAYSPDGKTLATGMHDGTVLLWDVPTR